MFFLIGLGNPGFEYQNTRHNIGREVCEAFADKMDFSDFKIDKNTKSKISSGAIGKEKVEIILPETFMNLSGNSIFKKVNTVKKAEKLIVVQDDLDMPIGKFKIIFNRGSGGHKGIESIIKKVKTKKFIRIKIGIASVTPSGKLKKPNDEQKVIDHVLGKFKKDEQEIIKKTKKQILKAIEDIITEGYLLAMNNNN